MTSKPKIPSDEIVEKYLDAVERNRELERDLTSLHATLDAISDALAPLFTSPQFIQLLGEAGITSVPKFISERFSSPRRIVEEEAAL